MALTATTSPSGRLHVLFAVAPGNMPCYLLNRGAGGRCEQGEKMSLLRIDIRFAGSSAPNLVPILTELSGPKAAETNTVNSWPVPLIWLIKTSLQSCTCCLPTQAEHGNVDATNAHGTPDTA